MKSINYVLSFALVAALAPVAAASPSTRTSKAEIEIINEPVLVIEAQSREHADGERVAYHATEAEIARRDLLVARFEVGRTRALWDQAVAADHPNDAGHWAILHWQALQDRRDALGRWMNERAERDIALSDFRDDWNELDLFRVAQQHANQHS